MATLGEICTARKEQKDGFVASVKSKFASMKEELANELCAGPESLGRSERPPRRSSDADMADVALQLASPRFSSRPTRSQQASSASAPPSAQQDVAEHFTLIQAPRTSQRHSCPQVDGRHRDPAGPVFCAGPHGPFALSRLHHGEFRFGGSGYRGRIRFEEAQAPVRITLAQAPR